MSKLITTSNLSRFWTNAKSYIDTALSGKANATHTHDYAATGHTHDYAASNHSHSEYALKTEIPESVEIATDAEIDALFA